MSRGFCHRISAVVPLHSDKCSLIFAHILWHSVTCNDFLHFSACSGFISAVLGTPADVVKTRVMNQQYVHGRCVCVDDFVASLCQCACVGLGAVN